MIQPRLSVAIPVYNFASVLPQTLDSLAKQQRIDEVEILILDGGSTDTTPDVVARYRSVIPHLTYVRKAQRGGIDRDMAQSVEAASGRYVWLFSGDDLMCRDALSWALDRVADGPDLVLCRHHEWSVGEDRWSEYPIFDLTEDRVFDFGLPQHRIDYAKSALTSEAFFSFIGGLIVRRELWNSVPYPETFDRTCWAHAARLAELASKGMTLAYTVEPKLYRRPDNDSFMSGGLIERFRIGIDGYKRIADEIYGRESAEAGAIARILRTEFGLWQLLTGKFVAQLAPDKEDAALNARLVRTVYPRLTRADLSVRWRYARVSAEQFARTNPVRVKQLEAAYGRSFQPRMPLLSRMFGPGADMPVAPLETPQAPPLTASIADRAIAAIPAAALCGT